MLLRSAFRLKRPPHSMLATGREVHGSGPAQPPRPQHDHRGLWVRRPAGLSARGRAAVATTRAVRADIVRELGETLGADRVEAARRAALDALEWAGGADAARSRRVPPPR